MADVKITALTAIGTNPVNPATFPIPMVDLLDNTITASGTTKKVTVNQILGSGGTATLASATITGAATVGTTLGVTGNATLSGDLTVRTNKLAVTSTGVGCGTASPLSVFTAQSQASARLSVRTTDAVFGSIAGGTAFDSLNGSDASLVPFGCRGSTISFGSSGGGIGLQLDASNNVNVPLGNVVMGTSGKGIDFSAVTGGTGTATANVLNDYEEGTFTPTIVGTTDPGTATYTRSGRYTKVGNLVTCQIYLNWTAHTGTGDMRIGGLPFATASAAGIYYAASIGFVNNIALTAGYLITGYALDNSSTVISLQQYPTGGGASITIPMDVAGSLIVAISYAS